MSCKYNTSKVIEWRLSPDEVNRKIKCNKSKSSLTIFDALFKNVECAGNFDLSLKDEKKCSSDGNCNVKLSQDITMKKLNTGSTSSVKAEHGLCNFHTHPLICYQGMQTKSLEDKCIWGWPSGEDMREAICFMMKGNLIHLVFTLEGVYSLQVNPNYINVLQDLSSSDRGYIISIIENYFKSTHGFRNLLYNRKKGTKVCRPEDWIKFANNFTLDNLLTNKNKCSPNLPCKGVPDPQEGSFGIEDYFDQFGMEKYECTKSGHITTKQGDLKYNHKKLKDIITKFKNTDHTHKLGKEWKSGHWYKVQFSPNLFNGKSITQITKGKNADFIYNLWESIGSNHNQLRFNTIPIKFHTYEIVNKSSCKLSFGSCNNNKKVIQAFGRNRFKR